jgi:hypothetical protein
VRAGIVVVTRGFEAARHDYSSLRLRQAASGLRPADSPDAELLNWTDVTQIIVAILVGCRSGGIDFTFARAPPWRAGVRMSLRSNPARSRDTLPNSIAHHTAAVCGTF